MALWKSLWHLRGALKQGMPMSIQRTPIQVQIMTEINKHMSLCARLMWPPGPISRVDLGLLQQCRQGLALDIASHSL